MDFEKIIFNHHSLPFPLECKDVDDALEVFIKTCQCLRLRGVRTILIDGDKDLWNKLKINDKTSFGAWLKRRGDFYRKAGNSSMCEQISRFKNSILNIDYRRDEDFLNWPCMSSCLSEQDLDAYQDSFVWMVSEKYSMMLISVVSRDAWKKKELTVEYSYIAENCIERREKSLYNHTDKKSIEKIQELLIKRSIDIHTIKRYWGYFFPKIERGKNVDEQLDWLSTRPQYQRVLSDLHVIARRLQVVINTRAINIEEMKAWGVTASDESDSVKHSLARSRCFPFQNHTPRYCWTHLKYSDGVRVHYEIDEDGMHIGYIGKHLPI